MQRSIMSRKNIYRITFHHQDKLYQLYSKGVFDSELFGFIEVEDLLFGESSMIVVDPSEEKLRNEFRGVKRILIPIQNVERIDVVEKEGVARELSGKSDNSNISPFPMAIYQQRSKEE